MFDDFKALKRIQQVQAGGIAELSRSQIIAAVFNLKDLTAGTSRNVTSDCIAFYNKMRKCKTKELYDFNKLITEIEIMKQCFEKLINQPDSLTLTVVKALMEDAIEVTNSIDNSDFITNNIGYFELFSVIHAIVCFYIYLVYDGDAKAINSNDALAKSVLLDSNVTDEDCNRLLEKSTQIYLGMLDILEKVDSQPSEGSVESRFITCSGIVLSSELGYEGLNEFVEVQIALLFAQLENTLFAIEGKDIAMAARNLAIGVQDLREAIEEEKNK